MVALAWMQKERECSIACSLATGDCFAACRAGMHNKERLSFSLSLFLTRKLSVLFCVYMCATYRHGNAVCMDFEAVGGVQNETIERMRAKMWLRQTKSECILLCDTSLPT